jgi:hypothetical protein
MECSDLVKIFIGAIVALVGAIIWLVKTGRKDVVSTLKNNTRAIDNNDTSIRENTEVMKRVEKLLTNWRGH